jgi:hypothetical protein
LKASILDLLRSSGEQLDAQIAQALRIPMATVTPHVSQLCAAGEMTCCQVTRYLDGAKIEGTSCRLSCNMPPPARGRKPGAKKDTSPDMHAA